jgi:ankyrin repeat protein
MEILRVNPSLENLIKQFLPREIVILHTLVQKGELEGIRHMITETSVNIDAEDNNGITALHHAVIARRPEVVELLLEFKANVNTRDKIAGLTPIVYAIQSNQTETAKLL